MRIGKKYIFLILFIMLLISSVLLIKEGRKEEVNIHDIVVINRGRNSEEFSRIRAGMEQASSDMNINLKYITLKEESSIKEQKEILEGASNSEADAILISPVDYTDISDIIQNINKKIPIVLFESKIDTKEKIPYISCDNYKLGQELAEEVLRNGNTRSNILIIENGLNYSSITERCLGFIDEISKSKNTYETVKIPDDESEIYDKVRTLMEENKVDVVVSFESDILEAIGKSKKYIINNLNMESNIEVYGTGSTSTIISLIEEKVIDAIVMQNEFNVGYLSVETAVNKIEKKKIDSKNSIKSALINSRNMYSKENQKILFPIVR